MEIKNFIIALLGIFFIAAIFTSADITPSPNLLGLNQFTITNYSIINGTGNLSTARLWVAGTEYSRTTERSYIDGRVIENNLHNHSWNNLTNFPVECPAGTFLTAINSSNTCASVTGTSGVLFSNGSVALTDNWDSGNYNISSDVLIADIIYIRNSTGVPAWKISVNASNSLVIENV